MICWVFALSALCASVVAAFVGSMKRATLALWIAGLAMGCVYLSLGAETLAVVQWIVSTLVAISLFFFAVMFGEYERQARPEPRSRSRLFNQMVAVVLGGAFAFVVYLGAPAVLPGAPPPVLVESGDLAALGRALAERHLLSVEVLALTLLLVLVGGGVIARPDAGGPESPDPKTPADEPSTEVKSC